MGKNATLAILKMPILILALFAFYPSLLQAEEHIIASIAKDSITKKELLDFASSSTQLRTYLQIPNGSETLLRLLIDQQLLIKEGQMQGIPRPEHKPGNDRLYARIIQDKLLEKCELPADSDLKKFYSDHPKLFSTPLYLRLRRISLMASSDEAISAAQEKLSNIKHQLESNLLEFARAVKQFSQDILSKNREGDLGYIPILDDSNPAFKQFMSAKEGDFIGPILEKTGLVNLYQIIDRREPILDSYEAVKSILPEEFLKHCNTQRYDNLINALKKKWPVQILVDDVAAALQAR